MSNKDEFPKMLCRDTQVIGAQPVWGYDGLYCAVAANQDEQDKMLAAGYRVGRAAPPAPAVAAAPVAAASGDDQGAAPQA